MCCLYIPGGNACCFSLPVNEHQGFDREVDAVECVEFLEGVHCCGRSDILFMVFGGVELCEVNGVIFYV